MKDFKRRLAIVLAACMVLTNVMPAFAEETAEIPAVGNEIVGGKITETELDVATPEEALYEDAEIENDDIEEITPSDGDIEEASPSEAYAFIREAVVDGVRITLTADAGVFPENAELYAVKIEDDETKEAIDEAVEKEKGEEDADKNVASDLKFDIKMLADGEEIQPDTSKGSVKVTFALEDVVNDCLDINVYHVKEDAEENLVAETLDVEVEKTGSVSEEEIAEADTEDSEIVEGTLISAETDGFSYYVVEFTYNGLTYELPGSGRVQLSEILAYVGIAESAEDAKGKVTKVEISNTDLFSAEKDGDDWTITSHQSFTSEEWMKVEFDGLEYKIIVTDPTPITTWDELKNAIEHATAGAIITLTQNLTASPSDTYISVDRNITLDLNNCTLDRGLKGETPDKNGNVIRVTSGASLTLKNGTITGSNYKIEGQGKDDGKGAVLVNNSYVVLENVVLKECTNVALYLNNSGAKVKGCTFSGNTYGGGMVGGAAIDVGGSNKQKITIEDCRFENNVITGGSGSAIHLYGNCDMTIKDSTFTGNRAESVESADDGGVICAYKGSLTLNGCTITGNRAAAEPYNNTCGGVSVSDGVKPFIIKGKTIIADNTCGGKAADLSLQNEGAIFKVEGLKPESKIGVMTVYDIEKGASAVIGENATDADLQYFFADNTDYSLICEDGKLKLSNDLNQKTVADILATVDDFPTTKENGWVNENGKKAYVGTDTITIGAFSFRCNNKLTRFGTDYVYSGTMGDDAFTFKFKMLDGVLQSIELSGVEVEQYISSNGTYKPASNPDPKKKSSNNSSSLFTGTWGNPVTNGSWTQDANGVWHYTTTRKFANTWGYIVNPYAKPGQHEADWFYFDNAGNMLIGWQLIGGKWYYLNPFQDGTGTLGACLIGPGKTPDGYEIDDQGAWTGR